MHSAPLGLSLLGDWGFCVHNSDCANNCCSNVLSTSDGRLKCTPGTNVCNAPNQNSGLTDWTFCAISSQCIDNCCSNQYSKSDGKYKCTPGGTPSQCIQSLPVASPTSSPVSIPTVHPSVIPSATPRSSSHRPQSLRPSFRPSSNQPISKQPSLFPSASPHLPSLIPHFISPSQPPSKTSPPSKLPLSTRPPTISPTTSPSVTATVTPTWTGVNSYFLHTLSQTDQNSILTALKSANIQVVRIFINGVSAGSKGSSSVGAPDLEQNVVGQYDDTVLSMIDSLMVRMAALNMKLIIAIHDRYSLGCWETDGYVAKYGLPVTDCRTVNQPTAFYSNKNAIQDFDNRIAHVLAHKNPLMDGRMWSSLDNVIYAFDIENESQGHMDVVNSAWLCGRAEVMRSLIPSGNKILVSTGGGTAFADSLAISNFQCSAIDLVAIHTSDVSSSDVSSNLRSGKKRKAN